MMGLPTETMEDIKGIADTAQQVVDLFYTIPDRPKGKGVQVTISVACFVPKPDTPFQFCAQDRREELREKQKYLLSCAHSREDQGQLPRFHHQCAGGRLRQGRPPPW